LCAQIRELDSVEAEMSSLLVQSVGAHSGGPSSESYCMLYDIQDTLSQCLPMKGKKRKAGKRKEKLLKRKKR
jgi:hypothetical protein